MLYEDWCATGQLTNAALPIEEGLLSDILHGIGDVSAAVADVVVPGSGAVIDFINMLSYFAEAHFSNDSLEKTKLIISGFIQAFAILDPINAITVGLKAGLNRIFSAFVTRTPDAFAMARAAARNVESGLNLILTGLNRIANLLSTRLSSSAFAGALRWLSNRLGITNAINWIKTFITQTAVPFIKSFLTRIRDTFNPSQAGANTPDNEFTSLLIRGTAKYVANQYGAAQIHNKASAFADTWWNSVKTGDRIYTDSRITKQDATYLQPKILPKLKRS